MSSSQYLERFEVVGRGKSMMPDGSIVVEAGWDVETVLEAAVVLKLGNKLKNVRIQAEFRGYMETRWESMTKEASKPEADDYPVTRNGRVFQQLVDVVYDLKDPIMPNPVGGSNIFPFKFTLPKSFMPPSFETVAGTIQYYIKCSMLYQEGINLLKSSSDVEMPVKIIMPDIAAMKMLSAPSHMQHQGEGTNEKVDFAVEIQKRILAIGDTLEVDVFINATPGDTRIRSINASLRSVVSYVNVGKNIGAQSKVPRPLSEMSQSFPLVKVGGIGGAEPIARRVFLLVDPELAVQSFESPFISSKTFFRLEITIDDSETPNISYEVPIVVVPPIGALEAMQATMVQPPSPRLGSGIQPGNSPNLGPAYGLGRKPSNAMSEMSSLYDGPSVASPRSTASNSSYYNPIISPGGPGPSPVLRGRVPSTPSVPRLPRSSSMARGGRANGHSRANSNTSLNAMRPGDFGAGPTMQRSRSFTNANQHMSHEQRPANGEQMMQLQELERLNSEQTKLSQLLAELQSMEVSRTSGHVGKHAESIDDNGSTASSSNPREDWTVIMVADWVRQIGAEEPVVEKFIEQQIDGVVLMTLNGEDLRNELAVVNMGLRRRIMIAIDKLKKDTS
ncbi:hypothetical protein BC830DRAFT_239934 [Chytriomyces sp. MP71]|nr:hypothetical protein BC830DRAFT_239934 [Chytriomyces sp. MP71]